MNYLLMSFVNVNDINAKVVIISEQSMIYTSRMLKIANLCVDNLHKNFSIKTKISSRVFRLFHRLRITPDNTKMH